MQAHRQNRGLVAPKAIDHLEENGPEQMSILRNLFSSLHESVVLGKPGHVNFLFLVVERGVETPKQTNSHVKAFDARRRCQCLASRKRVMCVFTNGARKEATLTAKPMIIYMQIHTHTCRYILIHVNTCRYIHIQADTYTYKQIHAHTCKYMHIHANTCTYIHMHDRITHPPGGTPVASSAEIPKETFIILSSALIGSHERCTSPR